MRFLIDVSRQNNLDLTYSKKLKGCCVNIPRMLTLGVVQRVDKVMFLVEFSKLLCLHFKEGKCEAYGKIWADHLKLIWGWLCRSTSNIIYVIDV